MASNTQTSSLAAIFTKKLLASSRTGDLIRLNQKRLSISYALLTNWLQINAFKYIPANAGIFVFARLGRNAQTWEDESTLIQKCKEAGVLISAGQSYHCIDEEKGWARITFAVDPDVLRKGVRILADALNVHPPAA